ncbi:MAG: aminodeoxychorismate/anthranilate synthase component II [Synergistaceae bacterium]|jgi:anthranilate synthase component 2|nr:aminodeoxychorismate/anthranilate synthase component II [Synergistaceae bacterium]
MILLIDNYDSFSYNLYQLIGGIRPDVRVVRNDELTTDQIEELRPERVVLSPGPGRPESAGVCVEACVRFAGKIPLLGVCLGHQAIGLAFGATVSYAKTLVHGKQSAIAIDNSAPLFRGLPATIQGGRYHSLAIDERTLPDELKVTARSEDGEIMGVRHAEYELYGLQFHPESILTPDGSAILGNFLMN